MADIANALDKLNTDEVAQDKPTSEALFSKIGAAVNGLIERPFGFEVKTSSSNWTCPANVFTVLCIGVGGGGGGGEGGDDNEAGANGTGGNATTFNGSTVASGGTGGEGGGNAASQGATGALNNGRGRNGGQSGGFSDGTGGAEGVGGDGASAPVGFAGNNYGGGGLAADRVTALVLRLAEPVAELDVSALDFSPLLQEIPITTLSGAEAAAELVTRALAKPELPDLTEP